MTLGERIRDARLAAGLSQAQLAEKVGTSQQSIDRIEQGKTEWSRYLEPLKRTLDLDDEARADTLLARRVRERLDVLRISANAASLAADLGRDYVRDILRGRVKEPSARKLYLLAQALECAPEYLSREDGAPDAAGPPIPANVTALPGRDGDTLRQAAFILRTYGRDATALELDDLAKIISKAQERAGG